MKKINIDELKKIQLNILKYLDEFCRKNNINYWLDYGTLLGAVRHKGFIPWDDDIDIGMLRDDYEKLIKLFNNNSSNYKLFDYTLDNNWFYSYGKILDINTIMYEPDEKNGIKTSVFIDIFIYDDVPDDDIILNKTFKQRNIYRKLHNWQTYKKSYFINRRKYNFIRYPIHLLLQLFPKNYFLKKIINIETKFRDKDAKRVALLSEQVDFVFPKSIFCDLIEMKFEGHNYYVPRDYDTILKIAYNNYMELPPVDKRVSHHRFVAYYK